MRGVNKVIVLGTLGSDPDTRQFNNGGSATSVSVAVNEEWTDKNTNEKKQSTEWIRLEFTGKLSEIASQYLRKGSQVYVEGSMRTRKWTDQQTQQEKQMTVVRVDNLQMLGGGQGNQGQNQQNQGNYQNQGYQNQGFNNQNQGFNNGQVGFNQNQGGFNNQQGNMGQPPMPQAQSPMGQPMNGGYPNQPMNQGFNGQGQAPNFNNGGNGQTQQPPVMQTPRAGAVDDDIPFCGLSNALVSII